MKTKPDFAKLTILGAVCSLLISAQPADQPPSQNSDIPSSFEKSYNFCARREVIMEYQRFFETGNTEKMDQIFTPDTSVIHPVLGQLNSTLYIFIPRLQAGNPSGVILILRKALLSRS